MCQLAWRKALRTAEELGILPPNEGWSSKIWSSKNHKKTWWCSWIEWTDIWNESNKLLSSVARALNIASNTKNRTCSAAEGCPKTWDVFRFTPNDKLREETEVANHWSLGYWIFRQTRWDYGQPPGRGALDSTYVPSVNQTWQWKLPQMFPLRPPFHKGFLLYLMTGAVKLHTFWCPTFVHWPVRHPPPLRAL